MEVTSRDPADRIRATLRRHGLVRRPRAIRRFLSKQGVRFTTGNRLEVFETGSQGLAAMLARIRAAKKRIHLETYILRSDATGQRFIEAMAERARCGVDVRLLYDAFGSLTLNPATLEPLRRTHAQIVSFNPLRRFYPHWFPRRRDHRKLLIVDGAIAFLGGLNIGDEYDKGTEHGEACWRDTHVQIEGPAVRDIEAVFLESWFRADGPNLPWAELLATELPPCGDVRCAVIPDGPVYSRRMTRDLLVMGLRGSQEMVRLTSPYFAPDRRVLRALAKASSRGVKIDLLLAGYSDHPILRRAAHALLPRLLQAGARVWEHHASMLHAKTAVFDRRWALVGTSNIDRQSFEHSYEVNLLIDGGSVPAQLDALFDKDVSCSTSIDKATLASRNWLDRLLDRLSAQVLRVI